MNSDFMLPHGLASPSVETAFDIPLMFIGIICLIALFYLCLRIIKQSRLSRLSKYKQNVLEKLNSILDMEESDRLSQKQAYLLWRLVRKTGHYYFGESYLKASVHDSITMCVNTSNDNTSKALYELFYQLNQALYDPHKKIDKTDVEALLSDWLNDKQALTMEPLK